MIRERILVLIMDLLDQVEWEIVEHFEGSNLFWFLIDILILLRYCCSVWLFRPFHFYLYFYCGIPIVGKPDDY